MTVDRMIKASQIEITRAEGLNGMDFSTHIVGTWDEANEQLVSIARTVSGFINKVDFTVEFEDSFRYNGTIEMKANDEENQSLQDHIRDHLSFHLGLNKPSHLTEAEYQDYVGMYAGACLNVIDYMQMVATTYRIG